PNDTTSYNGIFSASAPILQKTSYDNFLPALNVKVDLNRAMVLRFAASQTLTRPNLTDVAPQLNFTTLRPGNLQASG
ncbi:hypothetical protein ACKI1K_46625, partial [Streptomyces scabiei]|uniref:hypothetical protein n=1 Tax=Streptomyces scabiei TaxID=1930 RepID=UPI0038F7DEA3